MQTLAELLNEIELKIRFQHRRIYKAINTIRKLEARRKRFTGLAPKGKVSAIAEAVQAHEAEPIDEIDKIPDFLDRANPVIAEEMTQKRKAAEAEARMAMPLSGRAALEAVRPKRPKRPKAKTDE